MGTTLVARVQCEGPAPMRRQMVMDDAPPDRGKEVDMSNTRPRRLLSIAVVGALAFAGCNSQTGPKAGGPGDLVILKMATVNAEAGYNPEIDDLDQRIKEVSGGNVRIDMVSSIGAFAPDAEQQVVSGVASGTYDLGFVGTRAFDTLGVKSFQALSAPMLIDSYELEQAVIDSDIPTRMMGSLDALHVTGLGVLADGLRKPIAVAKPLLGTKDWSGITFGAYRSTVASQAITALGAHQSEVIGSRRDEALDSGDVQAFEMNLLGYQRINLWKRAPYVTANVNLWPQTLAVIGNPGRLAGLTAEQRGWLTQAIHDTAARSLALVNVDAGYVSELCTEGTHFANASDSDIAALREAFGPVLKSLEGDPQTKEFIAEIEHLKQQTGPGQALLTPVDCGRLPTSPSPPLSPQPTKTTASTELDGLWEVTYTKDEFVAAHPDPSEVNPSNYGTFTLTFDRGDFTYVGGSSESSTAPGTSAKGTYVVDGDTIAFYVETENSIWRYRWSVYGGTLTFERLRGEEPGNDCTSSVSLGQCEPTGLAVKAWRTNR
jgi:TRAP-type C4-dicarboxylate transport system substrate-binding protein